MQHNDTTACPAARQIYMEEMRISITPYTYNGEPNLSELLQNPAWQDLRPCVPVVRDDDSTDSTRSAHRDREK